METLRSQRQKGPLGYEYHIGDYFFLCCNFQGRESGPFLYSLRRMGRNGTQEALRQENEWTVISISGPTGRR